jgi:hypothetical protein
LFITGFTFAVLFNFISKFLEDSLALLLTRDTLASATGCLDLTLEATFDFLEYLAALLGLLVAVLGLLDVTYDLLLASDLATLMWAKVKAQNTNKFSKVLSI